MELDFKEKRVNGFPGPFVRVENAVLGSAIAWWVEYDVGATRCVFRLIRGKRNTGWGFQSGKSVVHVDLLIVCRFPNILCLFHYANANGAKMHMMLSCHVSFRLSSFVKKQP